MYPYVHDRYQISPSEQIHVGDNIIGDVKVPKSLGIQVYHYQPRLQHKKRRIVERSFMHPRCLYQ